MLDHLYYFKIAEVRIFYYSYTAICQLMKMLQKAFTVHFTKLWRMYNVWTVIARRASEGCSNYFQTHWNFSCFSALATTACGLRLQLLIMIKISRWMNDFCSLFQLRSILKFCFNHPVFHFWLLTKRMYTFILELISQFYADETSKILSKNKSNFLLLDKNAGLYCFSITTL